MPGSGPLFHCPSSKRVGLSFSRRAFGRAVSAGVWTVILCLGLVGTAAAQESLESPPAVPDIAVPDVAERLDRLEATNRRLAEKVFAVEQENALLREQIEAAPAAAMTGPPAPGGVPGTFPALDSQPSDIRGDEPVTRKADPQTLKGVFDEGFRWETGDGEYELQFHNETQLDIRAYGDPHPDPVNQVGFYVPRMRLIFNGHLTEPIEYNVSINKGLGSLDLLDAYLNFKTDERLQFRVGRFRVPYTYDWYALSNQFLSSPERSVFALNYGYNRNFALMLHGELLQDEVDYALAVVNGARNSYFDDNADKDLLGYLNVRPLRNVEGWEAFRHLNLGASFAYGRQNQFPLPIAFRTSASATESAGTIEGVPTFLRFEPDVLERGLRELWEVHAAWYYEQLSLLAAIDGGSNSYGFDNTSGNIRLPTQGWHLQGGYFLTGETVERRTFVEPLRPFAPGSGQRGCGAIELQARFDHFEVDDRVFTAGLADPARWTNRVETVDAGVNWYLNKYVKVLFDWQHSQYHRPVAFAPGRTHRHSDLFWTRFQVYF